MNEKTFDFCCGGSCASCVAAVVPCKQPYRTVSAESDGQLGDGAVLRAGGVILCVCAGSKARTGTGAGTGRYTGRGIAVPV